MTKTIATPVVHEYAKRGLLDPYTGLWSAYGSAAGDTSGGYGTVEVVPGSPPGRYYTVDGIYVNWSAASGAECVVYLPVGIGTRTLMIVLEADPSSAKGRVEHDRNTPMLWSSRKKEDILIRWLITNVNGVNYQFGSFGRFYEDKD
jgi:hypothetical protein